MTLQEAKDMITVIDGGDGYSCIAIIESGNCRSNAEARAELEKILDAVFIAGREAERHQATQEWAIR